MYVLDFQAWFIYGGVSVGGRGVYLVMECKCVIALYLVVTRFIEVLT